MNSYAVFLRGINVGGINIRMAELREALAAAGFAGVKTLLASGNVVLASEAEPAAVKQKFERCLRDTFGYDAWVVVLTAQRVAELVEACPYPDDDKATHTYITLSSDTASLDELDAAGTLLDGTEQTRLGPEALAWLAPVGGTLDSPFSKISAKPKFKASTTTRNLRTLIKVRDSAATLM
ncbi:MAG: pyridoxamine 5-phosphate oxidase [Pseudarthrobacter sp.]|nr:pyridoxamine 5-phosphate oxidase [Pseudarthrobacter sp.]